MKTRPDNPLIQPGYYQHYKGPYYQVLDVARHSETEEWLVIYRPLYDASSLWARPLAMFSEQVQYQGTQLPRFRYLGDTPPA
ncbi:MULTISPECIES: DUF1653 domain-containing protein [Alkalimonas]|uniref:DUF1653 domain-containing protein n=1 Tax=Alkalimonas mucilaginosa TaxID=3057676 RepID=A0ABU7JAY6_9GAMM|nr:DUF1653 domain-containing protein [Alkalimonas sp. MEB004]MEE2022862.1 DUF1653 domain-containing protein [Alkalimonas sp. MEB004]